MNKRKNYPIMTYVLIGINVLIYALETLAGGSQETEVAVRFGALYTPLCCATGNITVC